MTHCPVCQRDVSAVTALHPQYGMCAQCPTCETPFAQAGGSQFARPEMNKDAPARPLVEAAETPSPVRVAPVAKGAGTDDIIAQMRARLDVVEKEIAARLGFEAERDRLRRMLAAAGVVTESAQTLTN